MGELSATTGVAPSPERLARLGLTGRDLDEVLEVADAVAAHPEQAREVARLAEQLRAGLGVFPGEPGQDPWAGHDPATDPYGPGLLPLLALAATADDLRQFHQDHHVTAAVSAATMAELGQQVRVHRQTFGRLGLHTFGWLRHTWCGALYWLGRLQFNLERLDEGWVCSTHIPQTGPLTPAAVDDSFAEAADFFPHCFPDRPVTDFWCHSWLLDPDLAAALPEGSNIARFQRRWSLYGDPMPGDDDAVYFTFSRRGPYDPATLPRRTTLERVVVDRLRSGGHWTLRAGRIPMAGARP